MECPRSWESRGTRADGRQRSLHAATGSVERRVDTARAKPVDPGGCPDDATTPGADHARAMPGVAPNTLKSESQTFRFRGILPAMIQRTNHLRTLRALLRDVPVVAILGARQIGKTTLARQLVSGRRGAVTTLDLEDPDDLARLADPMLALRTLRGLVVLDEVQRRPELFAALRVLVDDPAARRRFLVLGSASPELLRQTS